MRLERFFCSSLALFWGRGKEAAGLEIGSGEEAHLDAIGGREEGERGRGGEKKRIKIDGA